MHGCVSILARVSISETYTCTYPLCTRSTKPIGTVYNQHSVARTASLHSSCRTDESDVRIQEDGENLQVLHYANDNQFFQEHRDYFDPKEDPPDNFVQGGNRMVTAILYLKTPQEVCLSVYLSLSVCLSMHVSVSLCVCLCMYVCTSVFVCMCACMHVYVHAFYTSGIIVSMYSFTMHVYLFLTCLLRHCPCISSKACI